MKISQNIHAFPSVKHRYVTRYYEKNKKRAVKQAQNTRGYCIPFTDTKQNENGKHSTYATQKF